jgi:hypothetical protein
LVGVGGMGNKRDFPDVISLYGWGFGDNGAEVFASIIHQNEPWCTGRRWEGQNEPWCPVQTVQLGKSTV